MHAEFKFRVDSGLRFVIVQNTLILHSISMILCIFCTCMYGLGGLKFEFGLNLVTSGMIFKGSIDTEVRKCTQSSNSGYIQG